MRGREPFHELDLSQWRTYTDLITDSLWLLGKRDNQGTHKGDYWGNFVPQIPNQAMRRFTRQGELVIDLVVGVCIEHHRHGAARRLQRAASRASPPCSQWWASSAARSSKRSP